MNIINIILISLNIYMCRGYTCYRCMNCTHVDRQTEIGDCDQMAAAPGMGCQTIFMADKLGRNKGLMYVVGRECLMEYVAPVDKEKEESHCEMTSRVLYTLNNVKCHLCFDDFCNKMDAEELEAMFPPQPRQQLKDTEMSIIRAANLLTASAEKIEVNLFISILSIILRL